MWVEIGRQTLRHTKHTMDVQGCISIHARKDQPVTSPLLLGHQHRIQRSAYAEVKRGAVLVFVTGPRKIEADN